MKLVSIGKEKYDEYRLDAIFKAYKWDPQFTDNNTVARYALVLSESEAAELNALTNSLTAETILAETLLNQNLHIIKPLKLPRKLIRHLAKMSDYDKTAHVRLMRFDFHPVEGGGYAISEVNSDVPGGFAEASVLPEIAAAYLNKAAYRTVNFGKTLADAIAKKVKKGGTIALVHCTSFSDDRQVMQYLGDRLESMGFTVLYMAGDHLRFENRRAVSVLDGKKGAVDFIFRFTPIEWLLAIKPGTFWPGYFDCLTPACNHPAALYTQTKRLPLVFDALEGLGAALPAWRALLPETLDVKSAKNREGFIFKPASGRVGESISIKSACPPEEYNKILRNVKRHPADYVAQKMFDSRAIETDDGKAFHVCLGSYSVDGAAAGFYARISNTRRIDSNAADIPVLIEKESDKT